MGKVKVTSHEGAQKASQTLRSGNTGSKLKIAAASSLSQTKAPTKETSKQAASAASAVLRDGRTSKTSKSAAGSALAHRQRKKYGCQLFLWSHFINLTLEEKRSVRQK